MMKTRLATHFLRAALVVHLCSPAAWALEKTYWVWHRTTALSAGETRALAEQEVRTLYWHVGTLRPKGTGWQPEGSLEVPKPRPVALAVVPVLRLSIEGTAPLGEVAAASVAEAAREVAGRLEAREVQLDFDCPDRRLPEYAAFLAQCRARIAPLRLSATALASWAGLPAFAELQGSVDALFPMFYDLTPDAPAEVRAGRVLPLVEAGRLARLIESWHACRIPWFAGIPNFARVTVFNGEGVSRGHLRAWDWDGVSFNPALLLQAQSGPGATLLRAASPTVLANTAIAAGETVACRWPDLGQLVQTAALIEKAGATGVAIFRLPGEGVQGGWSLGQLTTLLKEGKSGTPKFTLRRDREALELVNLSPSDLAPRLAGPGGPQDRGWQLEVESSAGAVFREASPGEFAQVFGHTDPDAAAPKLAPVPLAQRLTYWFADLRADKSRETGLIQLAPGTDFTTLRWRIPGSSHNTQWQPIE